VDRYQSHTLIPLNSWFDPMVTPVAHLNPWIASVVQSRPAAFFWVFANQFTTLHRSVLAEKNSMMWVMFSSFEKFYTNLGPWAPPRGTLGSRLLEDQAAAQVMDY